MAGTIQAVRGMNDVLPGESARWLKLEDTVRNVFGQYGYRNIRTPIVEKTELFVRGIGEVTDIVEKEMYSFDDHGEMLSLRPEGTAPTVRAALEHNLLYDGPKRLWYSGPLFRHERPQKGRYRQYHTFGAEALGYAGPDVDIEQLIMVDRLWNQLGLTGMTLELNTIGSSEERRAFRRLVRAARREAHARMRIRHRRRARALAARGRSKRGERRARRLFRPCRGTRVAPGVRSRGKPPRCGPRDHGERRRRQLRGA